MDIPSPKSLFWIASSHKELKSFPDEVQDVIGRALLDAQFGEKHPQSRPLQGFGSAGVLEVVDSFRWKCISHRVYGHVPQRCLRVTRVSEEIDARDFDSRL